MRQILPAIKAARPCHGAAGLEGWGELGGGPGRRESLGVRGSLSLC